MRTTGPFDFALMSKILTNKFVLCPAACAVLPPVLMPLAQYAVLAPWGSSLFLLVEMIFVMGCMFGVAGIVLGGIITCRHATRTQGVLLLICSIIYCPATMLGYCLGEKVREQAFHQFTQRSAPLVAAIRDYDSKHGQPPSSLDVLVPEWLPQVPWTGIGGYPNCRYALPTQPGQYEGNEWVLIVETGHGLNFDTIMYLPRQNYPRQGYGGSLQPIDDWAYVHE